MRIKTGQSRFSCAQYGTNLTHCNPYFSSLQMKQRSSFHYSSKNKAHYSVCQPLDNLFFL